MGMGKFILVCCFLLKDIGLSFVIGKNKRRITNPLFQLAADSPPNSYILQYDPLFQAIEEKRSSNITTESEAMRIFHGRGGCFPGCEHLTLDWFPPIWLLTSHNIEISHDTITSIHDALQLQQQDSFNFVYQYRNDTGCDTQIVSGEAPTPHIITENGMKFLVDLMSSKNHGIFLDMANGRTWVRENTNDHNVLNMFAYTCGFSVAALCGGASQVVNIDMAAGPMKNGKRNHELNNLQGARFLTHNIFKTWGKLRKLGKSH
jgi:23S rRNA (cytosine1962-C5)-methyltransferase